MMCAFSYKYMSKWPVHSPTNICMNSKWPAFQPGIVIQTESRPVQDSTAIPIVLSPDHGYTHGVQLSTVPQHRTAFTNASRSHVPFANKHILARNGFRVTWRLCPSLIGYFRFEKAWARKANLNSGAYLHTGRREIGVNLKIFDEQGRLASASCTLVSIRQMNGPFAAPSLSIQPPLLRKRSWWILIWNQLPFKKKLILRNASAVIFFFYRTYLIFVSFTADSKTTQGVN